MNRHCRTMGLSGMYEQLALHADQQVLNFQGYLNGRITTDDKNTFYRKPDVNESAELIFYPFNDIETISPRPMLFITGASAHSREFSEDAYRLAGESKELFIVPGAGHVDLYDRVNLIPFDKLTSFFRQHL